MSRVFFPARDACDILNWLEETLKELRMKPMRTVLCAAIAAAGMAVTAQADASRGGGTHVSAGTSHWGGTRGAAWTGGGGHWSGGHWGGYRSWYGPRVGFYFGLPIAYSAAYWGWPYYYGDYYYPRSTVVERIVERYPASYPDGVMGPADETTEVSPDPRGAPTQGPSYMNYCDSAKAYYPKVTACPEGWKFIRSR
jgi:hypothetical protein